MMTQAINGINGILVILFLYNLIYSFSTHTYIEKDINLSQYYWPQLTEVYYICGGINAFKLTRLSSKEAIHIIMRQYMTYLLNSLTLWILQLSLLNNIKFTISGVLGFQNLTTINTFSYLKFVAINNQYLFGQVVILIYDRAFRQFRQEYCAVVLICLFIILRSNYALKVTMGRIIYNQYTFLNQPIQELNAFFQAYFAGILFNERDVTFKQNWLDFCLIVLVLFQQQLIALTQGIRRNLMDNQDWKIFLIIIFNKHIQTMLYMFMIFLLLQSNVANKLLNTKLIVYLGQNVVSSYVSFIITQQVMEFALKDIKIGPLDKILINIIVLGQLIYVLILSLLYSSLTKGIAIKLSYDVEYYVDHVVQSFCRLKNKYQLRLQ